LEGGQKRKSLLSLRLITLAKVLQDNGIVLFISGYKWEPSKRFWKKGKLEFKKKARQRTLGPDEEPEAIECLYEDEEEQKLYLLAFHPKVVGS
jgi:hypothetical protein